MPGANVKEEIEMTDREIEVGINVTLSDEDITDLMVTAIEGGIGYWACLDNASERYINAPEDESVAETAANILLNGGKVTFLDTDDHSTEWTLSMYKLMHGIYMFLKEGNGCGVLDYENGKVVIDLGQIDSERADMIMQYALFKKIIFG